MSKFQLFFTAMCGLLASSCDVYESRIGSTLGDNNWRIYAVDTMTNASFNFCNPECSPKLWGIDTVLQAGTNEKYVVYEGCNIPSSGNICHSPVRYWYFEREANENEIGYSPYKKGLDDIFTGPFSLEEYISMKSELGFPEFSWKNRDKERFAIVPFYEKKLSEAWSITSSHSYEFTRLKRSNPEKTRQSLYGGHTILRAVVNNDFVVYERKGSTKKDGVPYWSLDYYYTDQPNLDHYLFEEWYGPFKQAEFLIEKEKFNLPDFEWENPERKVYMDSFEFYD